MSHPLSVIILFLKM